MSKKDKAKATEEPTVIMEALTEDMVLPPSPSKKTKQQMKDEKKRRKRLITIGVVVGVVVIFGVIAALTIFKKPEVVPPVISEVRRGDFTREVTGSGALRPISSTLVVPQISGTVEDLFISEGDKVVKGQKLFTIKNDDLTSAANDANAAIKAARNNLSAAQSAKTSAKNAYSQAVADYNNMVDVYNKATDPEARAAAAAQLEPLKAAVAQAEAAIPGTEPAISAATQEISTAQSALDKANAALDGKTVVAPADGVILQLNISKGSYVAGGAANAAAANGAGANQGATDQAASAAAALEIADMSAMTIRAPISEADIAAVKEGQDVTVTLEALPGVNMTGKVTRISPKNAVDAAAALNGGAPGAGINYDVDIRIDKLDPRLRVGMTGAVIIAVTSQKDVLLVPVDALSYEGTDVFVDVYKGEGKATERRKISVGEMSETEAVVLDGLKAGEKVVSGSKTTGEPQEGGASTASGV